MADSSKKEVYVGEFNQWDIDHKVPLYAESLERHMNESGLTNIKTVNIEYRGHSYFFRRVRVYLTE